MLASGRPQPILDSLRRPSDFRRLIQTRPLASQGAFLLHAGWRQLPLPLVGGSVQQASRFSLHTGLVVPKKSVRRAVGRNLIKRWVRMRLPQLGNRLSQSLPEDSPPGVCFRFELVCRVRGPLPLSSPAERHAAYAGVQAAFDLLERRLPTAQPIPPTVGLDLEVGR